MGEPHNCLGYDGSGKRWEEAHWEGGSCRLVSLPYSEEVDREGGNIRLDLEAVVEAEGSNFDGSYGTADRGTFLKISKKEQVESRDGVDYLFDERRRNWKV